MIATERFRTTFTSTLPRRRIRNLRPRERSTSKAGTVPTSVSGAKTSRVVRSSRKLGRRQTMMVRRRMSLMMLKMMTMRRWTTKMTMLESAHDLTNMTERSTIASSNELRQGDEKSECLARHKSRVRTPSYATSNDRSPAPRKDQIITSHSFQPSQPAKDPSPALLARPVGVGPDLWQSLPHMTHVHDLQTLLHLVRQVLDVLAILLR